MFLFDGNGYLHYNHMGVATHAAFFLGKPTIGIAKTYLKIKGCDFEMPENEVGAYTDILIDGEVYGRALRTRWDVKPIFLSCGHNIDLESGYQITMKMINRDSRRRSLSVWLTLKRMFCERFIGKITCNTCSPGGRKCFLLIRPSGRMTGITCKKHRRRNSYLYRTTYRD